MVSYVLELSFMLNMSCFVLGILFVTVLQRELSFLEFQIVMLGWLPMVCLWVPDSLIVNYFLCYFDGLVFSECISNENSVTTPACLSWVLISFFYPQGGAVGSFPMVTLGAGRELVDPSGFCEMFSGVLLLFYRKPSSDSCCAHIFLG